MPQGKRRQMRQTVDVRRQIFEGVGIEVEAAKRMQVADVARQGRKMVPANRQLFEMAEPGYRFGKLGKIIIVK